VGLEVARFKAHMKPVSENGQFIMDIKLEVVVNLNEEQGADTFPIVQPRIIESLAAQKIKGEIMALIDKAQELNSDILGYGQAYSRIDPDGWRQISKDWYDYFPGIKSRVEVKTILDRTYLVKGPFPYKKENQRNRWG